MAVTNLEGMLHKDFQIKGMDRPAYPLFQGGMGLGISLWELTSAIAREGGIGVLSSVGLDLIYYSRFRNEIEAGTKEKLSLEDAIAYEIQQAKDNAGGGVIGINIMVALEPCYEESIAGAVKGGVDFIISGAGFPKELPKLVQKYAQKYGKLDEKSKHNIGLIPIVSSKLALHGVMRSWKSQEYLPDAIVLEGPKAGGHIGWPYNKVEGYHDGNGNFMTEEFLADNDLMAKLLPAVLVEVNKEENYKGGKPIPVIVAGGMHSHQDIVENLERKFTLKEYASALSDERKGKIVEPTAEAIMKKAGYKTEEEVYRLLDLTASAVQIGTRFAATYESGASEDFKKAIIEATRDDVILGSKGFGSPAGYPFAFLKQSPLYQQWLELQEGGNIIDEYSFCICRALVSAAGTVLPENEKKKACFTRYFDKSDDEGNMISLCSTMESNNRLFREKKVKIDPSLALYTIGREVEKITKIDSAHNVFQELIGNKNVA